MLIGENITKAYPGVVALDGVNVNIKPGRVTVVIGPSGSGKTTLIRSLALLDPPNSGSITIDGQRFEYPPTGRTLPPPWPRVTVVFQQLFLWPHLTLRQNILLPLRVRKTPPSGLSEMVDLFGMADFIDRYPNEVSIGQRQRAALARATILSPAYILLDEITSALDIEQTGVILRYLVSLRDRGIGLLLVTHLIGFARRLLTRREGDELVFLENGRVVASGGIDILTSADHPRLRDFLASADEVG
jgi:ABC-type polar amino acid transport system ATPase subunit